MKKALILGLALAGCSGRLDSLRALGSPDRLPRWVQSSADGRVVAFTEVKDRGADRLVIRGQPARTYHYL